MNQPTNSVPAEFKARQAQKQPTPTVDLTLSTVAVLLLFGYLPGVILIYLYVSDATSSYLYAHGLVSILPSSVLLFRKAKLGIAYWLFTALLISLDGFIFFFLYALASDTTPPNWH